MHEGTPAGTLTVVGTPIGHPDDLSARGADALVQADVIACEERREALRLLRRLGVTKDLIEINEHVEAENLEEVLDLLLAGKNVALVSDCGMPIFADPGIQLVRAAIAQGIRLRVVPGPTSLTTALAVSGFDAHRFYVHGFLSPKRPERRAELQRLRSFPSTIVFLDAPYRLAQVLADLAEFFGPQRAACTACDLTLPSELVVRDTLGALARRFAVDRQKREFVLIVEGSTAAEGARRRPR
jgi:16S rRNA (cytidine1402-2'-O)-methyltransferase